MVQVQPGSHLTSALQSSPPPPQQQQQPLAADLATRMDTAGCAPLRRMFTSRPLVGNALAIRSLGLPPGPSRAPSVLTTSGSIVAGATAGSGSGIAQPAVETNTLGIDMQQVAAASKAPVATQPSPASNTKYISPFAQQQQHPYWPQVVAAAAGCDATAPPQPQLQQDPQSLRRHESWPPHSASSPASPSAAQPAATMVGEVGASPWSRRSNLLPAASGSPCAEMLMPAQSPAPQHTSGQVQLACLNSMEPQCRPDDLVTLPWDLMRAHT